MCKNEETKVLCKTIYFNKPIQRMNQNKQSNLTKLEYSAKLYAPTHNIGIIYKHELSHYTFDETRDVNCHR